MKLKVKQAFKDLLKEYSLYELVDLAVYHDSFEVISSTEDFMIQKLIEQFTEQEMKDRLLDDLGYFEYMKRVKE